MQLTLVDTEPAVVKCWQRHFAAHPEITIIEGDILELADNTLVSPANSAGFMDGGIDALYHQYFGDGLQARVQDRINRRTEQRIPVGSAELVATGNSKIPYLIVAPTMEGPAVVDPRNAGAALFAVLRLASAHPGLVEQLYCPGLATGIGSFNAAMIDAATKDMAFAYARWQEIRKQRPI